MSLPKMSMTLTITRCSPGVSYSRDQVQFTFYNEPVLTQVIPLHAAARGGSSITFVGGNFADSSDLTCRFGMKSVTRSLRPSASMVVCTAPASNPGNVSIEVSNNGLDFTRTGLRFSFRGALTFGLVPSRGPVVGGTVVTITGLEASGSDLHRITFGSTFVPVESTDEGLSTVVVPAGSGAGVVSVTADEYGAEVVTQFEYDEAVHVESVKPSSGGMMGGTRITVTGRGFNADEGFCKFGGREDTSTRIVSVLSSNRVVCITPSSSEAGTVTVEVSTNEGLSYSRDRVQFTFYNEPVLTQVIPSHAAATGGSSITFVGGDFADSSDLSCRQTALCVSSVPDACTS